MPGPGYQNWYELDEKPAANDPTYTDRFSGWILGAIVVVLLSIAACAAMVLQ